MEEGGAPSPIPYRAPERGRDPHCACGYPRCVCPPSILRLRAQEALRLREESEAGAQADEPRESSEGLLETFGGLLMENPALISVLFAVVILIALILLAIKALTT